MLDAAEHAAVEGARVARLATADGEGRPHVVPICFALIEHEGPPRLVSAIDEKPKAVGPSALRRVRDVRANPRAAVVVDRYTEDWERLGWVQLRGPAAVVEPDDHGHAAAVDALQARYDQYADHALDGRPILSIVVRTVRSWGDLSSLADPAPGP